MFFLGLEQGSPTGGFPGKLLQLKRLTSNAEVTFGLLPPVKSVAPSFLPASMKPSTFSYCNAECEGTSALGVKVRQPWGSAADRQSLSIKGDTESNGHCELVTDSIEHSWSRKDIERML